MALRYIEIRCFYRKPYISLFFRFYGDIGEYSMQTFYV